MRILYAILFAGFMLPSQAAAPANDTRGAALIGLETRLWEDARNKNYSDIESLLADDYVDHFPNGRVLGKAESMAYLRGVDLLEYSLDKFQVLWLNPDAAIVLYEARAKGRENSATSRNEAKGSLAENHAAVISAWARRDGKWLNVFYQETDIE